VFWLSGARYALDAVLVGEVVSVPSLLPVPVTPSWLLGLCNLRGVALAVVDLAAVLGMKAAAPAPLPAAGGVPVLVLRAHGVTVGIRIDRIEAVYPFESAKLTPSTAIDEHPAVKGLLAFEARGGFVATLLDEQRVAARLKELKFKKAEAGAA
jgi:chemotaxis signal transduction protein